MLTVFASVRSSPGVTTTALAVAGCLADAVVVEVDPDGSVLGPRYGLAREPGLATFTAGLRGSPASLRDHAQFLPGGVPAVVAPASPDSATSLWRSAGPSIAAALASSAAIRTVVADAGRVSPTSPTGPLLAEADVTVVVLRPNLEELSALAGRIDTLRDQTNQLVLVPVGDRPYGPSEIASEIGAEVLGVMATDRRAAAALAGRTAVAGPRALRRSALARSARTIAERLVAAPEPAAPPGPAGSSAAVRPPPSARATFGGDRA